MTETAERIINALAGILSTVTVPAGWDVTVEIADGAPLADDIHALCAKRADYTSGDEVLRVFDRELTGRISGQEVRVEVSALIDNDPHVVLSRPVHFAAARRTLMGSGVVADLVTAWVKP